MKCPKCGFVSFDELNSCRKCGTDLKQQSGRKSNAVRRPQTADSDSGSVHESDDMSSGQSVAPPDDVFESLKKDIDEIGVPEQNSRPADIDQTFAALKKDLADIDALPDTAGGAAATKRPALSGKPPAARAPQDHCYAGFGVRLMAYTIDNLILSLITLMLFIVAYLILGTHAVDSQDPFGVLSTVYLPLLLFSSIIEVFYFTYFNGVTGQTVGKLICGLRVVDDRGGCLGIKKGFGRYLGYFLCRLSIYAGFIWIVFDKRCQGWHDKLCSSYVVKQ
ncbi:MAG: RDD family protein [Deltaproteobacteria bacterium]|nr:RDD family protein [Deltaproteobacteria bacterium]